MYFRRLTKAFINSYNLWKSDYRLWLFGIFIATFGFGFYGFKIFGAKYIENIFLASNSFKSLYVIWEILSFLVFTILGSIFIPMAIIIVKNRYDERNLSSRKIYEKAKNVFPKFIVLMICYYVLMSILTGGGSFVIVLGLIENLFHGVNLIYLYNSIPSVFMAMLITIGIICSFFISLIFIFASNYIVLESKDVVESIYLALKTINKELIYIFSAWIGINIILILPVIILTLLLNLLLVLSNTFVDLRQYSLYVGLVLFIIIYSPVAIIMNIFWTEIYLNIKGKISLSK